MDKAKKWTEKKLNAMLKHLSAVYSRQERQINEILQKINEVIGEKAKSAYLAIVDANTDDEKAQSKKEYSRLIVREFARNKEIADLVDDACRKAFKINQSAAIYANDAAEDVFVRNYNSQTAAIADGVEGYTPHNATAEDVREVGAVDGYQRVLNAKKDMRYTRNNIRLSFAVGASLGLPLAAIAKRAAKNATRKNRTVAEEHVLNVVLGSENQAKSDAGLRAKDEGYVVKKQWIATLDNRTRDSHARLDGVIIDIDKTFLPGLSEPKDKNARPEEVYNCRCTMELVYGSALPSERVARKGDVTGSYKKRKSYKGTQTERIQNMTYREWAEWRKKQA